MKYLRHILKLVLQDYWEGCRPDHYVIKRITGALDYYEPINQLEYE